MARISIDLQASERRALAALAKRERREMRAQAAVIVRQELERLGLLAPSCPEAGPAPMTEAANGNPA